MKLKETKPKSEELFPTGTKSSGHGAVEELLGGRRGQTIMPRLSYGGNC